MEDYLEAILLEQEENHVARVRDIADRLNVTRASVSGAVRSLDQRGLVAHDPYQFIRLTPEGERIARQVARRHKALLDFLTIILGVEEEEAETSACVMEHVLSPVVEERLTKFMGFFKKTKCQEAWEEENEAYRCACTALSGSTHSGE